MEITCLDTVNKCSFIMLETQLQPAPPEFRIPHTLTFVTLVDTKHAFLLQDGASPL